MSQQINLLSADLVLKRDLVTANKVALAGMALLLAFVVAAAWIGSAARQAEQRNVEQQARVTVAKTRLAELSRELAGRDGGERAATEMLAAKSQLARREELMAYLDSGGVGSSSGFARFLRGFAHQAMSGVWLTEFSVKGGGGDMEIHGRMLQPSALPEYIRRLSSEPAFRGRSFASLDIRRGEADKNKAVASGAAAQSRYVEFALTSNAADAPQPGSAQRPAEKKP